MTEREAHCGPTWSAVLVDGRLGSRDRIWLLDRAAFLTAHDLSQFKAEPLDIRELRRASDRASMSLLMRIALRIVVGCLSPGTAEHPVEREDGGKPLFSDGPAFSLSHSRELGLLALASNGPIGCDIEWRREVRLPDARISALRQSHGDTPWRDVPSNVVMFDDTAHDAWSFAERRTDQGPADALKIWVDLEAQSKMTGIGIFRLLHQRGVFGSGAVAADQDNPIARTINEPPVLWRMSRTFALNDNASNETGAASLVTGAWSIISDRAPSGVVVRSVRSFG